MLPLLAFLAFVWFERSYLQIIYYDFTSQLEPQHRIYNWLWCVPWHCPCVQGGPRVVLSALLGWRQASDQPVGAAGRVGLLPQPKDLHRSSALAGDASCCADDAHQQRVAPLFLPPQHARVHRLGALPAHRLRASTDTCMRAHFESRRVCRSRHANTSPRVPTGSLVARRLARVAQASRPGSEEQGVLSEAVVHTGVV